MKNNKKVFWGVLLIALAVFIILNQLGIINIVVGTMHMVLGIIFFVLFVKSLSVLNFPGIFITLAVLWMLFDEYIIDYDVSELLVAVAAILLAVGFSLLFPKAGKKSMENFFGFHCIKDDEWADYEDKNKTGKYQKVKNEERDGYVYCSNKMGGAAKYINCQNLKYASINNSFGELQVYFDNAIIDGESAEINVDASFGELQLYLPAEWVVINQIDSFAASVNEHSRNKIAGEKRVILTGSVSFGEVKIIYV